MTYERPKHLGKLYVVEAWAGTESVGWRSGNQARSVGRLAEAWAVDRHADRIYVRRETVRGLVASWTPGRGWFDLRDDKLAAQLEREGRA
jgi:hypothetical protein